jgi:serine/threonine protein kinase
MLSVHDSCFPAQLKDRDLKLENLLFDSPGPADAELKMIDFGLSKHFKCGTRGFEKNV